MSGPTDVSFSRIQTYQRCPWLYNLVYEKGWRTGPTAGMAVGQSLHRSLDRFCSVENTERTLYRLFEIFDEEWVNEGFSSPAETIEKYEAARTMLARFHAAEQDRHAETMGTEVDFELPMADGIMFRGTIDRLDRLADGVHEIVEYKTNAEGWPEQRTATDLQMTLYALAMRRKLNAPDIRLRYHFLSSGESRAAVRTEKQLSDADQLIRELGAKIKSRNYEPNHAHCARCEFARRCENYRPVAPSTKEPT